MLPMDCHTHTGISPDGSGTVAGHIAQAEKLELPVLALTEHVEMNRYFPQAHYGTEPRNEWEIFDHAAVLEQSLEVVTAAKEQAAANGLTLLCGMEMGQPNADFGLSESVSRDMRLDFIIASLHELLDKPDFFCLDYTQENIPLGSLRCAGSPYLSAALYRGRGRDTGAAGTVCGTDPLLFPGAGGERKGH